MVKLNKKKMTEQEEFKILQNICKYKTAEKCAKGDNFGKCDCEHCKVLTKFKNQINSDFTVYCPQKSSKGYECIPYSFYGSIDAFSSNKSKIDFIKKCFSSEEECKMWIDKNEIR